MGDAQMKTKVILVLALMSSGHSALAEGRQWFRQLSCSGITSNGSKIEYSQCVREIESEPGYFNDCQDFGVTDQQLYAFKIDGVLHQSTMAMRDNLKIEGSPRKLKVKAKGFNDGLDLVIDINFDSENLKDSILKLGSYDDGKLYMASPDSVRCTIQ